VLLAVEVAGHVHKQRTRCRRDRRRRRTALVLGDSVVELALDSGRNVGRLGSRLTGDRSSGQIVEDTLLTLAFSPTRKASH